MASERNRAKRDAIDKRWQDQWRGLREYAAPFVAAMRAVVQDEFGTLSDKRQDMVVESFCMQIVYGFGRPSDVFESAFDLKVEAGLIVTDEISGAVGNRLFSVRTKFKYGPSRFH